MKIREIVQGISSVVNPDKKDKGQPSNLGFQQILQDANSKLKDPAKNSSVCGCNELAPTFLHPAAVGQPVNILSGPEVAGIRFQAIQSVEKTLDRLDQYQKAIADPKVTLKEIDRMLDPLMDEVNGLNRVADQLPPSDSLRKIAAEVGVLSTVEIERFNRGEYI